MELLIVLTVLGLLTTTSLVALVIALVRARRAQQAVPMGLLRAGAPTGVEHPAKALDHLAGRPARVRIGGPAGSF